MKQFIIKKKKVRFHRKAVNALWLAAAICLLVNSLQFSVNAQESGAKETQEAAEVTEATKATKAGNTASYNIFHQHTGSEADGGGCYQAPVYHAHQGNETDGSFCYQNPVYHVHIGNEADGGSCYGTVVYHTHQGNTGSGGACYGAVYHSHTGACSVSAECTVTYQLEDGVLSSVEKECYHHGVIAHQTRPTKASHGSCGAGTRSETIECCVYCGVLPGSHSYMRNVCGLGPGSVVGYSLSCQKTDTTPESYEKDCIKDENTIDAYALSCDKNEQTIDGYSLDCGWDTQQPIAKLMITNETEGSGESVRLSAKIEDLTGGRLDFSAGSYQWYDSANALISQDDFVEISENGEYRVEFIPQGQQNNLAGLTGSIQVGNVYKPTPAPVIKEEVPPQGDSGQGNDKDNGSGENSETGNGGDGTNADENEEEQEGQKEEQAASPIPTTSPTVSKAASPTASPTVLPKKTSASKSGNLSIEEDSIAEDEERSMGKKKVGIIPQPTPTAIPVKLSAVLSENGTDADISIIDEEQKALPGQRRKEGEGSRWMGSLADFFEKPAVKMITVTTGTLAAIGLTCFILLFLRKTVKVYNDDGTGRMIYLGRCAVTMQADVFCVVITEDMVERSCTNRYAIRPGCFLIGRSPEQEMIVCKGKKRISVYLNKEMIVVI